MSHKISLCRTFPPSQPTAIRTLSSPHAAPSSPISHGCKRGLDRHRRRRTPTPPPPSRERHLRAHHTSKQALLLAFSCDMTTSTLRGPRGTPAVPLCVPWPATSRTSTARGRGEGETRIFEEQPALTVFQAASPCPSRWATLASHGSAGRGTHTFSPAPFHGRLGLSSTSGATAPAWTPLPHPRKPSHPP